MRRSPTIGRRSRRVRAGSGDPNASGKLTVSDVDDGEAAFAAPASLNGIYGSFTFNAASGSWTLYARQ
nr:VCBS domain-containing protein [Rhizobium ruizarguesonis]